MTSSWRRIAITGVAAAATVVAGAALAITSGKTALGGPYASGGIGRGEVTTLDAQRDRYSLWVITAAKVSGAYLADVQLKIRDKDGKLVLDHKLAGPWLLVDLPLGRFEVEAAYRSETFRKATTIHAGDHHQMVFYFDVPAEVLPDPQGAPVLKR